jgi:poly-beta-1,6-N-acetyl-D-glucosamine synthase
VRALHAGIAALGPLPEIVVSVDADISFAPDYFARLLTAFAADERLGIASGSGWELEDGEWRQRHLTGSTVWGASRAFRRECLEQVLPFEERLGWDGVDQFKANARGWTTRTLTDLPFQHHRAEGHRGGAWRMRVDQGRTAHFVGYRPSYLLIRALHQAIRHPTGLGLVWGYLAAALERGGRLDDPAAVAYLHSQQRLRDLPARAREALGRAPRSAAG